MSWPTTWNTPTWPVSQTATGVATAGIVPNPVPTPGTIPVNPTQYTAEQWATMQQQNWQQWMQWQQQYQQWQQQYGEQYQKSMNALSMQTAVQTTPVVPPTVLVQQTTPAAVQPPLPVAPVNQQYASQPPLPFQTTAAPPPPLPDTKPPPPPEQQSTFNYSQPPPTMNMQSLNFNKPPPPVNSSLYSKPPPSLVPPTATQSDKSSASNISTSKPPPSLLSLKVDKPTFDEPQSAQNKRKSSDETFALDTTPLQKNPRLSTSTPGGTWNSGGTQEKKENVTPSKKKPVNPNEITDAERKFDEQFKAWEEQFNKWKEQNANHPDKQQYKEYEAKWEAWRNQLLDRREQMRRKRMGLSVPKSSTKLTPPVIAKTELTPIKTTENLDPIIESKTIEEETKGKVENFETNEQKITETKFDVYNEPPKEQRKRRNRLLNESSLSESSECAEMSASQENINTEETTGNSSNYEFMSKNDSSGIPGLDLVEKSEEIKEDPVEKPKGPDYDAISRGINSILGDENLVNIISLVSQQKQGNSDNNAMKNVPSGPLQPPNIDFNQPPPNCMSQRPPYQQDQSPFSQQNKIPPFDLTREPPSFGTRIQNLPFPNNSDFNRPPPLFDQKNQQGNSFGFDQNQRSGPSFGMNQGGPPQGPRPLFDNRSQFQNQNDNRFPGRNNLPDVRSPPQLQRPPPMDNFSQRDESSNLSQDSHSQDQDMFKQFNSQQNPSNTEGSFAKKPPALLDLNITKPPSTGPFGGNDKNNFSRFSDNTDINEMQSTNSNQDDNRQSFNQDRDNNRPAFNQDRDNNRSMFNQDRSGSRQMFNQDNRGNNRPLFNQDRDNNRPPFNSDNNRAPYNQDRDNNRTPFNQDRDNNRTPFNQDRDNNRLPFGLDRDNNKPPFNQDRDNKKPSFNQDRDNNRPSLFNQDRDNNKLPFNQDRDNIRPLFNQDRDSNRPPFNQDRDNNRPPFNQDRDNNRPPFMQDRDNNRPPFMQDRDNNRPPFIQDRDNSRPPFMQDRDNFRPPFNQERGDIRPLFSPGNRQMFSQDRGENRPFLNQEHMLNPGKDTTNQSLDHDSTDKQTNETNINLETIAPEQKVQGNKPIESDIIPKPEDEILTPTTVIDYNHKSLHQDDDIVFIEPLKTIDYEHKSKNIPLNESTRPWRDSKFNHPLDDRKYNSSYDARSWRQSPYEHRGRDNRREMSPYSSRNSRHDDYDDKRFGNNRDRLYDSRENMRNSPVDRFEKKVPLHRYDKRHSENEDSQGTESLFPAAATREIQSEFGNKLFKENSKHSSSVWDDHQNNSRNKNNLMSMTKIEKEKPKVLQNVTLIDDLLSVPGRTIRPHRIVIILRGPPGSGKTFLARLIKDKEVSQGGSAPRILSLDDYFMVEVEKDTTDSETGRKIKTKEMVYEYEQCMEIAYLSSLVKAFKKTISDGFFSFIIVDCVNDKVKQYEDMWSFAKQNGFQVYVCQMELDVASCTKRNIHGRTEEQVTELINNWETTPTHHLMLDATSLLQAACISEVEMDEVSDDDNLPEFGSPKEIEEDEQFDDEAIGYKSKWETMEHSFDKLARLDGINKPLRHSTQSMEDYLQLDDWKEPQLQPGRKRVRWADLVEKSEQEKMRAIGFVVGQTDWNRMMDPSQGSNALTQTKFIEPIRKY